MFSLSNPVIKAGQDIYENVAWDTNVFVVFEEVMIYTYDTNIYFCFERSPKET